MINTNYPTNSTQEQVRQGQIALFEPEPDTPDFNAYPWHGVIRAMYWANRRGLYHLGSLAYSQFRRLARGEGGDYVE